MLSEQLRGELAKRYAGRTWIVYGEDPGRNQRMPELIKEKVEFKEIEGTVVSALSQRIESTLRNPM